MTKIFQKLCTPVTFEENESRFSSKSTTVSFANKDKDWDLFKAQVSLSSRSLRRELEEEVKVNDAASRPGPAGPFLLTNVLPALPLLRKASLNFHPSLVGHQLADLLLYLLLLRSCRVRRRGRSVVQ